MLQATNSHPWAWLALVIMMLVQLVDFEKGKKDAGRGDEVVPIPI